MANLVKLVVATELGESIRELRKVRGEFGHMQREASTTGEHIHRALTGGVVVAAAATGVAIAGITEELKKSFEAASNYEVSQKRLKVAVNDAGVSWKKYGERIDETITKQADMSGFMRTDLADSFANMIRTTGNVRQAFRLNSEAMDIARTKGLSLASAQSLVARVANGSYTGLKRLGIAITPITTNTDKLNASTKKATDAQKAAAKAADDQATKTEALRLIQQKFGGQASAYANTAQGEIARFHVSVEELQTTLGRVLLPLVTKVFGTFADWMNQLQESKTVRDLFNAGVKAMAVVVRAVSAAMGDAVDFTRQHWPEIQQTMHEVLDWAQKNLLPVWRSVMNAARQVALNIVDAIRSNWPLIKSTAQAVWAVVGPILHDFFVIIRQVLIPAIILLSKMIGPALKVVLVVIRDTFKVAGPYLKGAADLITGILTAAVHIARSLPGIWNTIKRDAVGAWRAIVNTVDGFINHLIDAYDWVAGKIGLPKIPDLPTYGGGGGGGHFGRAGGGTHNPGRPTGAATGIVKPRPGGMLLVGEAGHPEAVLSMNPAHAERTFQLMGQVAQHLIGQTRQMAVGGVRFPQGSQPKSNASVGGFLSSAGSFLNPLSHLPSLPSFGGALAGFGSAIVHKLYDAAKSAILKIAGSLFGGGLPGSAPHIPSVAGLIGSTYAPGEPRPTAQVLGWIRAAMAATMTPPKPAFVGGLLARAWQESGWNPHAINLWDSNARRGTPSKGWFQTIGPTFASYALPGHGDIWNPVDNAIAAIRYMRARYQGNLVGYTGAGYASGGVVGAGSGLAPGTPMPVLAHVGEPIGLRGPTIIVNNHFHSVDLTEGAGRRRIAAQVTDDIMRRIQQQAGR